MSPSEREAFCNVSGGEISAENVSGWELLGFSEKLLSLQSRTKSSPAWGGFGYDCFK